MSLTFYHVPNSTSSITEAVLSELGAPCDRVELSIEAGDTRAPTFLALNPNGRVPVIVHDNTPIWESAAITLYLGEVFGAAAGLYPPPGPRRGEAMKWIVWSNVSLAASVDRLSAALPPGSAGGVQEGSRDWVPPEQRSAGEVERARGELRERLGALEKGLVGRDFLLGGDYSVADTHVWCLVGYLEMLGVDMEGLGNVKGWMKRCGERPKLAGL